MAFLFSLCFAFGPQSLSEAQASLEVDIFPHCVDLYVILPFTTNRCFISCDIVMLSESEHYQLLRRNVD